jgi:hypothetical protein
MLAKSELTLDPRFATTAYLSLDVSTTCTGIAAFDSAGLLLGTLFHKPKVSKKDPNSSHYLVKARGLGKLISAFEVCPMQGVWIEEPLQNSANRKTVNVLLRYNGVCSLYCWEYLGCLPTYLSVYDWRRRLCPEFLKPKPGSAGKRGEMSWHMPSSLDPKAYIYAKVNQWHPGRGDWEKDPSGALRSETFDMSDAVGVGTAGLLAAGVLDWEALHQRPRLVRGI